jgi:hypothetical protein
MMRMIRLSAEAGDEGDPGAVDQATEFVPPVAVGAQDVLRLGLVAPEQVDARGRPNLDPLVDTDGVGGREGGDQGSEHRNQQQDGQHRHADGRGALVDQLPEGGGPQAPGLREAGRFAAAVGCPRPGARGQWRLWVERVWDEAVGAGHVILTFGFR